jgi:hypothetical protein
MPVIQEQESFVVSETTILPEHVPNWVREAYNLPVTQDGDERQWNPLGNNAYSDRLREGNLTNEQFRNRIRDMAKWQSNIKRALKLYGTYVLGRGFDISIQLVDKSKTVSPAEAKIIAAADVAWKAFTKANRKHWTVREFGRRTWRDGEQFTLKKESEGDVPEVRFIDPEEIDKDGAAIDDPEYLGIVTKENDTSDVKGYIRVNVASKQEISRYGVNQVQHTKIDADSTERRGCSRFVDCLDVSRRLELFAVSETTHRQLQSSIVMTRKIRGGSSKLSSHLDNAKTSTTTRDGRTTNHERIEPGTIFNHNDGVELDFKQPDSNFSDASHLARYMLLQISASTGWPYFMLTGDSSDSNFASSLVAESPVVFMVEDEQDFFGDELTEIYMWVIDQALGQGLLGDRRLRDIWSKFEPVLRFPKLVSRDRLQESQATNIDLMNKSISKKESRRRISVDSDQMDREIEEESKKPFLSTAMDMMNQDEETKSKNASDNQGDGKNQGDGDKPVSHDDSLT